MKYFFILGSNPTLSIAELATVFKSAKLSILQKNIAMLITEQKIKANIIEKLGGIVKFGLLHDEINSISIKDILKSAATWGKPEKASGKFCFGISFYGKAKLNLKVLSMEFKKLLKQSGISSRWVTSHEPVLSSVVVEQNKLTTDRGVEIVIIPFNKKLLLGRTLAVQPFKQLSFRDYGRPARDDRSGMLPPKLAQIMINMSGAERDSVILDPFCGSGTILTEAALMGHQNLIGSDISSKAIADTKTNIAWIQKSCELRAASYELFQSDILQISKHVSPNSIDAIITEPYLGPQRGKIEIEKIKPELEKLYSDSLKEFYKILKPNSRVVMVWPFFVIPTKAGIQNFTTGTLNPNLNGFHIINPLPADLQKNTLLKPTFRNTIIYGREGQKVWREIVVLEKKLV